MLGVKPFRLRRQSVLAALALLSSIALTSCLEQKDKPTETKAAGGASCTVTGANFQGGIDPGIPVTATTASIAWNAASGGCDYIYKVYQVPDMSTPVAFATTGTTSVTLTGLSPGATTQYVVRIFDGAKEDSNLAVVNVTMPPQAIGSFNINTISSSTDHRPTFSWTAASNAQSYKLEVAWEPTLSTSATVLSVSGLTSTSYAPTVDLPMGKYWVRVTASATGTTDVIASNALQSFTVYPLFDGCLQLWKGSTDSITSWQTSGCSKSRGRVLGYLNKPNGLVYDPSTGYLYIGNDNTATYGGLARWDMNSFSSTGFMDGTSIVGQGTFGFVPTYTMTTSYTPNHAGVAYTNRGCSDGTYYYYDSQNAINRINLTTQSWAGRIGGGLAAWDTSTSSTPTLGTGIGQFGGVLMSVACNATDGYLYITDYTLHRIARWTKAGVASGVFGTGTGGAWSMAAGCCAAGSGTAAVNLPYTAHLSSAGILYFGDFGGLASTSRVARITNLAAPSIDWICSTGWDAINQVGSGPCSMNNVVPSQIATDSTGKIYLTDTNYIMIRKYSSAGNFIGGLTTSAFTASSPTHANSINGIAVKPDGSLLMVSDPNGSRVMLFDNNLAYLGFIGAGVAGIAPASTVRPPVAGLGGTSYYRTFDIDSSTDGLYVALQGGAPSSAIVLNRYSLTAPTIVTASNYSQLATAAASPCTVPGANGICTPSAITPRITASKTTNYIYFTDYANGRVVRWTKDTLTYGGWIGNATTGWQMGTTVANSAINCAFKDASYVTTDKNGYIYVFDGTANRVLVWKESDGSCVGTLGGGYTAIQSSLVAQASAAATKYFTTTINYYEDSVGTLGDWVYVFDRASYVMSRYAMTNGDPSTLSWTAWIGGGASGWRTTNYAGVQAGIFDANSIGGDVGAGGVFAYDYSGGISFKSMGDGSSIGKALDGTNNSYAFSTGTPSIGSGAKTGDGQVLAPNYATIRFDNASKKLYIYYDASAIVVYK